MAWRHPDPDRPASSPHASGTPAPAAPPDLQTQFEDLVNMVLAAEADWRLNDRLDLADRLHRFPQPERKGVTGQG